MYIPGPEGQCGSVNLTGRWPVGGLAGGLLSGDDQFLTGRRIMSNSSMCGKLVLVTGGAKNVGKAICGRFVEQGAHVVLNFFHSLDASKRTAAELRALGATVDVIRASVAQQAQVDRMFDEIGAEHFDRAIDTNLKGAFWCARRAAALMARWGGGAIVNVSSVGATLVPANYLVVGTAKAVLESLTRYLAVEYAGSNIRVNSIDFSSKTGTGYNASGSGELSEFPLVAQFPASTIVFTTTSK